MHKKYREVFPLVRMTRASNTCTLYLLTFFQNYSKNLFNKRAFDSVPGNHRTRHELAQRETPLSGPSFLSTIDSADQLLRQREILAQHISLELHFSHKRFFEGGTSIPMLNNMLNIVAHDEEEANRQERLGRTAGTPPLSSAHQDLGGARVARDRRKIPIPKELFVLLVDFMKTRKMAGHLSIEFRDGAIASLEAVTKKHYK